MTHSPLASDSTTPTTAQLLHGLNPAQQAAVQTVEGAVLIIAGPGSGKTRVLTHRIAYLIATGVDPYHICAVTFTNKAAKEMKHRLEALCGSAAARLTVGTFHALGVRMLRQDIDKLGYDRDFAIYDDDDQLSVVKQALKDLNFDEKQYAPRAVLSFISKAKSALFDPAGAAQATENYFQEIAARVYRRYQETLTRNRAVDFDDLIRLPIQLLVEQPAVRDKWQRRFRHILVDEYQDTNHAQYIMVKLLAEAHGNLCVVGDPDQCLPAGTRVRTPQGEVPIETIRPGDHVMSGAGRGTNTEATVQEVHTRPYSGPLVQATLRSGRVLCATPNHMCFARLGVRTDVHYVYLMYRQDKGYRIGIAVGARADGYSATLSNGLQVRTNQEHADKVWILRVCPTREAASYYEQFYAFEYGIPTTIFYVAGRGKLTVTQESIDQLFARIDTRTRAVRLMEALGLYAAYPHYRPQGIASGDQAHRMVVHLTAFGGHPPSGQTPWCRHRVWLNTSDRIMEQQVIHGGVATRAGSRGTWRVERALRDFAESAGVAEEIAQAAGGAEIARWAVFTSGDKFAFQPAGNLRPTMIVPVWQDGAIVEDEVVSVETVGYSGTVYDLDVAHLHNYIAEGVVVHNSIYGWRQADIQNILNFERDYPQARVVLLEQNYRSTQTILDTAQNVIQANTERKDKQLWTENAKGGPITVYEAYDENDEAAYVAREISRVVKRGGGRWRDYAVMYRMNAQSRAVEQAFLGYNVPYQMVGGVRFYSRKEIKDVLALLRLVQNPFDSVAFIRAINNTPLGKGIGAKTLTDLEKAAGTRGVPIYTVLQLLAEEAETQGSAGPAGLSLPTARLLPMLKTLDSFITAHEELNLPDLLDRVLEGVRLSDALQDGSDEGLERWQNVLELRTQAGNYADLPAAEGLNRFLEDVALISDLDNIQEEKDAVTLITLHAAKGLEFPVVFMVGVEEGLLPHSRAVDSLHELEEERRLAYVGITRAQRQLYLLYAFRRTFYGETRTATPSRFLLDVPKDLATGLDKLKRTPVQPARDVWGNAPPPSSSAARRPPSAAAPRASEISGRVFGGSGTRNTGRPAADGRPVPPPARPVPAPVVPPRPLRPAGTTLWKAGEKARHASFGEGIVVQSKPTGGDEEVTIAFAGHGIKRLLASLAHLERV